jgi:transcriptional regulator with XRE-family HTH domain
MQRPQVRSPQEIQALRKELGWSRSDLAAALNVTRQTVSNWERGASQPSEAVAETMAAIQARARQQEASGGEVLSAVLTGGLVGFLIGQAFSNDSDSE